MMADRMRNRKQSMTMPNRARLGFVGAVAWLLCGAPATAAEWALDFESRACVQVDLTLDQLQGKLRAEGKNCRLVKKNPAIGYDDLVCDQGTQSQEDHVQEKTLAKCKADLKLTFGSDRPLAEALPGSSEACSEAGITKMKSVGITKEQVDKMCGEQTAPLRREGKVDFDLTDGSMDYTEFSLRAVAKKAFGKVVRLCIRTCSQRDAYDLFTQNDEPKNVPTLACSEDTSLQYFLFTGDKRDRALLMGHEDRKSCRTVTARIAGYHGDHATASPMLELIQP
jgi:hypothetical protein